LIPFFSIWAKIRLECLICNMFLMEDDLQSSIEVLRKGGLILYPTDTVWGIGCDATNETAVAKVFELKKRVDSKALIILVAEEGSVLEYTNQTNIKIFDYIKGVHQPTTVIYEQAKGLAKNLISPDGSIAIRICKELFCNKLIKEFGKPIVSTSANISGYPTPLCFADISLDIKEGVDFIVRYRQDDQSIQQPSSIVKWDTEGNLIVIRK
ncbi:MAG: L-threonylcarbamoyladenylate synthase, partial [Sediminibacterium sp.]